MMTRLQALKRSMRRRYDNVVARAAVNTAARYDAHRYWASSSTSGPHKSQQNLAAKITERTHAIEKGLSLPHPRPGFGGAVVETILRLCDTYIARYGDDAVTAFAYGALDAYVEFNRRSGLPDEDIPHWTGLEAALARPRSARMTAGTTPQTRTELFAAVGGVDLSFFTSRHSVRQFTEDPVDPTSIEFAAAAAATAPAVCNRQFGAVHVWTDPAEIERLLEIQGGARGFAAGIPCLAMVTVSLRNYWGAAERNQAWIDGGLFAMNFMLGVHAQGLGAVPLNWSKVPEKDREMRRAAGLDDQTGIILLVGIGNVPDQYVVASSPRFGTALHWH